MTGAYLSNSIGLSLGREERNRVRLALILSLLAHLLLILIFRSSPAETVSRPIEVSFVPRTVEKRAVASKEPVIPIPEKQYVTPSDAPEKTPPENTRLLSERDSAVAKEQIKRGEEGGVQTSSSPKHTNAPERKQPQEASKQTAATGSLRLDDATLDKQFARNFTPSEEKATKSATEPSKLSLENYEPFSKSFSKTGPLSLPGSSDYLPNIPDGDITLLNAKADRYAVFVRRVALQVFGALRRNNWARIPFQEVMAIRDFVTVEAVLSKEGKLLEVITLDSSGNRPFDQVVYDAAHEGAWDQNPPVGALAADGKIHFIFKSRTWVRRGAKNFMEQRWLLLGTGLK